MSEKNTAGENRIVIKKNDYEKYQLVLPYSCLAGRKRQLFIYSELEKLHPCFSDEFSFDTKLKSFSKKGISSEVMVIHKYKLAEYEARRVSSEKMIDRACGTGFLAESCKRQRFFVDKKVKRRLCLGLSLILLFFLFTSLVIGTKIEKGNEGESFSLSAAASDTDVYEDFVEESGEELTALGQSFFADVKGAGGRILSFHWSFDGFTEELSARVKGVYPEDFTGVGAMSVNYEKAVPLLQVSGSRKNHFYKLQNISATSDGLYQKLRKILADNEALILEEKLNPYKITFSCKRELMQNIFFALDEAFNQSERLISLVDIKTKEDGFFDIEIGALTAACKDKVKVGEVISLNVLAENWESFGENLLIKSSSVKENKNLIPKNLPQKKTDGVKIGEIKSSEGKIISFYKSSDGKIKKITEEK